MYAQERELKETLSICNQYKDIVDTSNIVSKTDLGGFITYVNNKFIEISGYSKEELLGKPHNIVRSHEMPSATFKELWSTIQSKKAWNGIVTNRCKDGSSYTVDAYIFPILDSKGEILEYMSIRHDITQILRLSKDINDAHIHITQQEQLAKEKLEKGIITGIDDRYCATLRHPIDILSGDFHSIHQRSDGSIFIYLIDGQGHGISPALTVFAVSSVLNQMVHSIDSLDELIQKLYPMAKTFLGEIEQLSYIMVVISPNKKNLSYASGGMYPFLIKSGDKIMKIKANNTPFMNFSPVPIISEIEIDEWESLMLYSDGIIEHEIENFDQHLPEEMIKNPLLIKDALEKMKVHRFEDDVTIVYLENH